MGSGSRQLMLQAICAFCAKHPNDFMAVMERDPKHMA
jgi:hypothetical protein